MKTQTHAPVYVAGTLQDSGKTSLSLGLMQAFIERGLDPGYTKPVGQRYVMHFGQSIDKDAYLFHKVFDLPDRRKMMSPIAVRSGFTRQFIENPIVERLQEKILRCTRRLQERHPSLIIEGTGHAGVGSCFGLSNARVAQLLGARVVIVAAGGIGKPIDEVSLNLALFQQHSVPVMGVVLNKVHMNKYEEVVKTVSRGLELIGTRLLGAIPYVPTLTYYTVGQVADEFDYRTLYGRKHLMNRVESTVVLAMRPEHSARYIRTNSMVIAPIDRPENIQTAIVALKNFAPSCGGIILTGGVEPESDVKQLLVESGIPVLATEEDTFTVSARLARLEFKIQSFDLGKINDLKGLARRHVDVGGIIEELRLK